MLKKCVSLGAALCFAGAAYAGGQPYVAPAPVQPAPAEYQVGVFTSLNHGTIEGTAAGLGVSFYMANFEAGLSASSTIFDTKGGTLRNGGSTYVVTPAAFIGYRDTFGHDGNPDVHWALGVNGAVPLGEAFNRNFSGDVYNIGAYVALEYNLTRHLLLTASINPYTYTYRSANFFGPGGVKTYTHSIFSTGGVSATYLFDI